MKAVGDESGVKICNIWKKIHSVSIKNCDVLYESLKIFRLVSPCFEKSERAGLKKNPF